MSVHSEVNISVPHEAVNSLWNTSNDVPTKQSIYDIIKYSKIQYSVSGILDFGSGVLTDTTILQLPFDGTIDSLLIYNKSGSVDVSVYTKEFANLPAIAVSGLTNITSSNTPIKVDSLGNNTFVTESFIQIILTNNILSEDLFYSIELTRTE